MSGATFQALLMGGGDVVKLTLLDHDFTGNVGGGSHNFSMDCGAGGDIVLCAQIFTSGNFGTVTIGGVTATPRVIADIGTAGENVGIFTAAGVPSGVQTITLSVSGGSGQSSRWGAQLYSIKGQSSLTPASTATDTGAAPITATLNVPIGGAVLGTGMGGGATSATWSGITEDVDDNDGLGTVNYTSASGTFAAGNASLSTTITFNAGSQLAGAWAVWS